MKWKNYDYYNRLRAERAKEGLYYWHRRFAWFPKAIPEETHDNIVVPAHYVWLEHYEAVYVCMDYYRNNSNREIPRDARGAILRNESWHYRPHTDAKVLGENIPKNTGYTIEKDYFLRVRHPAALALLVAAPSLTYGVFAWLFS
jgi:hypothetical protein